MLFKRESYRFITADVCLKENRLPNFFSVIPLSCHLCSSVSMITVHFFNALSSLYVKIVRRLTFSFITKGNTEIH